jgi:hypothetical protein
MIFKYQGCSSPMRQIAWATEFCTVVPNICSSSVWKLYHVTILAPSLLVVVNGMNGDSPKRAPSDHHQDHANVCTSKHIFQCFSFFVVCNSAFVMGINFIYCKQIFTVKAMNHAIDMTLRTACNSWNIWQCNIWPAAQKLHVLNNRKLHCVVYWFCLFWDTFTILIF